MLRRIIAAGAAAGGLVLAGAVAPATAVTAAPAPVHVLGVTATSVTLVPHRSTVVRVTARLDRALVGSEDAVAVVGPDDAAGADELGYAELVPGSAGTTLTATFTLPDSVRPGLWDVEAAVFPDGDADAPSSYRDGSFRVKLPTALTVDAAPEPAAVGETLTVTGTLKRYGQSTGTYVGYGNRPVELYFDPAGPAPRAKVRTVRTGATGRYSTTFTATTTGVWSAQFAGSTYNAAHRSSGDGVVVSKRKTRLAVSATPKPVAKGGRVTVTGRLTRATSLRGTPRYVSYAGRTVTVWFDPAGPQGPRKVATTTTRSDGTFTKKLTQSVAGVWQVRFGGTAYFAASAGKTAVAVR